MSKLYVVVRNDLSIGLQAAQAAHALREFQEEHPELERAWFIESKTLVLLQTPDVEEFAARAAREGVTHALNYEPDLDGMLTAVALGPDAKKMVRDLPLIGAV